MTTYKILRFYMNHESQVVKKGLTHGHAYEVLE